MAGHSKWANIQHRKGAQDKKRGKVFTKLIREITIAVRSSGNGDVDTNPRLRLAVDRAIAANMPKDTIERAVNRGLGITDGPPDEEIRYEGYGAGGVAVMVDCLSNNRNRTAGEVRHAFTKYGGNLGTDGSVAFQFRELGVLSYPENSDEDAITEAAIMAGAEDVIVDEDGSIEVLTTPQSYVEVHNAMVEAGFEPEDSEVTQYADNNVSIDAEAAEKVMAMVEALENLDDVQKVYSNADISDEILEQLFK